MRDRRELYLNTICILVSIIPDQEDLKKDFTMWKPNKEEEERRNVKTARINMMLEARAPYEIQMERGLLLYSGKHRKDDDASLEKSVSPFARQFVEAKTAQEVQAISEYEFIPVEDAGDAWKVDFLKDINTHVLRKAKWKTKKHQVIRMKNIVGLSIIRVGYRKIMRALKEGTVYDEDGNLLEWEDVEVPWVDDIFIDVVPPSDFAIDPNARTIHEAMDCAQFSEWNWEQAFEVFGKDSRFKNFKHVRPGTDGRVDIVEYFNAVRDEWMIYASSSRGDRKGAFTGKMVSNWVELYFGPLPDDHKMLPFVVYHNNPSFVEGGLRSNTRTAAGKEVSDPIQVLSQESFWTEGDPSTIADLIDLSTEFMRSMFQAMKLKGQALIATKGNFRLDNAIPWQSGKQIIGGMGKIETFNLGSGVSEGTYDYVLTYLTQQQILTTGIDPRNLADIGKVRTATEALVQSENASVRLQLGIDFNEEIAELRLGEIVHKLIQQRYTKQEEVRLRGDESKEELARFDEVDDEKRIGKRFRRIIASERLKETDRGKSIISDSDGIGSFLARPEYIRTSEIDIQISTKKKVGQLQSARFEQAIQGLQVITGLVPLTQPDASGNSPLDMGDLPLKELVSILIDSLGAVKDAPTNTDEKSDLVKARESQQVTRVPTDAQ